MDKLILVIEDEAPIVDILKFNLTKSGYRVLTARKAIVWHSAKSLI